MTYFIYVLASSILGRSQIENYHHSAFIQRVNLSKLILFAMKRIVPVLKLFSLFTISYGRKTQKASTKSVVVV